MPYLPKILELSVQQEQQEQMVYKAPQERKAHQELMANQVNQEHKVLKEQQEQQEQMVYKAPQERKAHQELMVYQVNQEHKALKAQLAL